MANPARPLTPPAVHKAETRMRFFQTVDEVCPQATVDLRSTVAPVYDRAAEYLGQSGGSAWHLSLQGLRAGESYLGRPSRVIDPEIRKVFELSRSVLASLLSWAARYGFDRDDWTLERALLFLEYHGGGALPDGAGLSYIPATAGYWVPIVEPLRYRPDDGETVDQAIARAGRHFGKVDATHQAAGWIRPPYKPNADIHLRWLVRHQCLRLRYYECGNVDEANIRKEIKKLSALLGLTLRPARGRSSQK